MSDLYKSDYYQWLSQQKELLIEGHLQQLDVPNLIEAMELRMGDAVNELESHLIILLLHLLKYQYQTFVLNPDRIEPLEFRSWYISIDRSRDDIQRLVRKNPYLKREFQNALREAYLCARKRSVREMNHYLPEPQWLNDDSFPDTCLWTFEQVMTDGFLPDTKPVKGI